MSNTYTDESIVIDRDDMETVRMIPQMYGPLNLRGYLHMMKEIIQNSVDEAAVTKTPITIEVVYDDETKRISITDNARGIPVNRIEAVFTKLHTSGKSGLNGESSAYSGGATSGVHGAGAKFTNALSNELICEVCRDGEKYRIRFEQGKVVDKLKKVGKSKLTGTHVEFVPDYSILGEFDVSSHDVDDIVEILAYLSPVGTTILYDDKNHKAKYTNKNGLEQLLVKKMKEHNISKMPLDNQRFFFEKNGVLYDVLFTFSKEVQGTLVYSYCNYCVTDDNGHHVEPFIDQISKEIKKYVESQLKDVDKKKLGINVSDCREGLVLIISAMHPKPVLENQTKNRVGQTEFINICKTVATNGFKSLVSDKGNRKYLQLLVEFVKNNAQARLRTKDVKNSFLKQDGNESSSEFFGSNGKLKAATGNGYKELFITEGDSAAGSMSRRDTKTQAIFPIRGVMKNVLEVPINKIIENEEIKTLIKVLKTNIGNKFDLDKLAYDKIIIATDADVDGLKIASLLCVLFITHMPEIVKAGKLYKAVPPLYSFSIGKKKKYVTSYGELAEYVLERIVKEHTVEDMKGNVLSLEELKTLMTINKEYLYNIYSTSKKLALQPEMVEDLAYCSKMTDEDIKTYINSKYPHLTVDRMEDGTLFIEGIFKSYQYMSFDKLYHSKFKTVIDIMSANSSRIYYKLNGETVTLFKLLSVFEKFTPKDITRYKGLTERLVLITFSQNHGGCLI